MFLYSVFFTWDFGYYLLFIFLFHFSVLLVSFFVIHFFMRCKVLTNYEFRCFVQIKNGHDLFIFWKNRFGFKKKIKTKIKQMLIEFYQKKHQQQHHQNGTEKGNNGRKKKRIVKIFYRYNWHNFSYFYFTEIYILDSFELKQKTNKLIVMWSILFYKWNYSRWKLDWYKRIFDGITIADKRLWRKNKLFQHE